MAALLKAHDNAAQEKVRAFHEASAPHWPIGQREGQPAIAGEAVPHETQPDEATDLRQQLSEMDERWSAFTAEARQAEANAFDRGVEQGERQAQQRDEERLQILAGAADEARMLLAGQLDQLQQLSLQIAQNALGKILGDSGRYPELIAQSIRHRCQQLSMELVTGIRVSAADFSDPSALSSLRAASGSSIVETDPALESGACMIDLKLGHYDIGIGSQWHRLCAFLDELEQEAAPA